MDHSENDRGNAVDQSPAPPLVLRSPKAPTRRDIPHTRNMVKMRVMTAMLDATANEEGETGSDADSGRRSA